MESLAFETALGFTAFARSGNLVHALTFGHSTERAAARVLRARLDADLVVDRVHEPFDDELVERLFCMSHGQRIDFDDVSVDMTGRTTFQCRVLQECRAIPWGEFRSYGQLAKAAGRPGAARAVGSVMASNRTPLIIPCHRVVLASGGAGHFSAPQGAIMRRRLLALEEQESSLIAS